MAKGKDNPNGYTYALASQASPETMTIWHNGQLVLKRWSTPASRPRPTADGTFPVYLRYHFQIMQGTNPDGSHYADPVDVRVLLQRRRCGALLLPRLLRVPQSLGCVELP